MDTSVAVRDLKISYGALDVIKDLQLEIARGEFLVLLGPSGCGKSTLLNAIAGLIDVADGEVWISGRNVTWEEPKDRGIGMVFQSYALYPQMSVEKNLSFSLRVARHDRADIERRVARAAEILQIEPLLKRKPAHLSGGQRQRVAIGRALVRDVDVFLFDEPLSNLDAKLRVDLRVEIKRLHQRLENTMIYVTHDQIEALTLADRIAVMKGGVIQQLDDPLTIYNRPKNRFVAEFIGSPSMNFFEGSILEKDGRRVFDADGMKVPLPCDLAPKVEPGRAVSLGVRPEHIRIGEMGTNSDEAALRGTIDIEEPMGPDTLVWIRTGERTLAARCPADARYPPGQTVPFVFDMRFASIFDAKSGERL
ncbi:ABC transporter ATP-binding protein [Pararhizobium mangrovi]|uniref:sn-glycerol-3-phosphate ABC transporter ATP-binding protein UgpC n=1 Tax=Pararhizobium mangrovi TaxID=2590452 RepID=A0A506UHQ9_9HYPH|nr:sn-glycerol-3-phosphate ABC transporter ATP-binding protein UgpC [Pararhizobium mangrovi]TPW32854.1 sn-glycerol-3-phosphate ABC transporter ATP-binding protein UgpC [Pararhizobium mangrovi]